MKLEFIFTTALLAVWLTTAAQAADTGKSGGNGGPSIPMVHIKPGSFSMGEKENGDRDEGPVHRVSIGYAFEIGKTEVTQGQWQAVMGDNPSKFKTCGDGCPVETVSFEDALRFIKRLNMKTGKEYRLPSEAEWEYACRAGGNGAYCGGDDPDKLGWYKDNSGGETTPVAKKKPNAWGLYDMSGNVWEWVQDMYHPNYNGAPDDGSAWTQGGGCPDVMEKAGYHGCRVLRGGSWLDGAQVLRAAIRGNLVPANRFENYGFRLARTLP